VETHLRDSKIDFRRIDGKVNAHSRAAILEDFRVNPNVLVLLLTTGCGAAGYVLYSHDGENHLLITLPQAQPYRCQQGPYHRASMEPDGRKTGDRKGGPTRSKSTGVYLSVHNERYNRGGRLPLENSKLKIANGGYSIIVNGIPSIPEDPTRRADLWSRVGAGYDWFYEGEFSYPRIKLYTKR